MTMRKVEHSPTDASMKGNVQSDLSLLDDGGRESTARKEDEKLGMDITYTISLIGLEDSIVGEEAVRV